jgi:hypothetical protein
MELNKNHSLKSISALAIIAAIVLSLIACSEDSAPTGSSSIENISGDLSKKGAVIHSVSLGGADLCEALGLPTGCDANFSLTAKMHADGSVSGQWQDTFSGGGNGIHVAIDCMIVDGNSAILGGVITHGSSDGNDLSGLRAVTRVVDNGTSQKDPADQISFSYFTSGDCGNFSELNFEMFDLTHGQVKVK